MQGQMLDYQLTLTPLLERARRLFPRKEIVTKAGPSLERYTYAEMTERVGRLANALEKLGVQRGDRVATFAWNNSRHLEIYFAGPWVISGYYNDDRNAESFHDGWFRTGDVVTIDPEGFVQIVDRV